MIKIKDRKFKIGLSLSGGGYRAAIYHLGTLRKLREMGILEKVDVISTISGGSITGACYGLKGENFEDFEKCLKAIVQKSIIKGILLSFRFICIAFFLISIVLLSLYLLFTRFAWVSTLLLIAMICCVLIFQFKIFPVSTIINRLYSKWFFEGKALKDFNPTPLIAINATNLETGRPFTFSKNKMSDSLYEHPGKGHKSIKFKPEQFPISLAVAASTCVPFAFTPIFIDKKYFQDESDFESIRPCLVDGGVYDNQGVHKLTQKNSSYECDVIIVSDAGNMMPKISSFNNVLQLLMRTSEIFMNRIKNYQMIQHVYDNYRFNQKSIAYQSLGWDLESCLDGFMDNLKKGAVLKEVAELHGISQVEIDSEKWDVIQERLMRSIKYAEIIAQKPTDAELTTARGVKTNLTKLEIKQIDALVKHAECITELQVKLYAPILIASE
ncbi:patatin-like phospholipase family protein [Flavobacterium aquidurense]|uniref:patatin-like phospholipase family protein n=1 Tax=Flavobacterium aquidurense TaxID=362413 RepID=UPI00286102AC|nr:patatin-like phospholipase family protein [Flavobacterium aquidurense]MDR7371480.1 NTE family protein [Flavobacterium aquidurense]